MKGQVEAFNVLGGVPSRHIRYDNLKPAVNRVCTGRSRAFYCIPGREDAHRLQGQRNHSIEVGPNHLAAGA